MTTDTELEQLAKAATPGEDKWFACALYMCKEYVQLRDRLRAAERERDTSIEAFAIEAEQNKTMTQVCEYLSEGSFIERHSGQRNFELNYLNMAYDLAIRALKKAPSHE